MARLGTTIAAGTVGAALMYAFDPERGRARRARIRDKLVRAEHQLADEARSGLHDLKNRTRGVAHEVAAVARPDKADDDIVAERVRARLGRAIFHPHGVELSVRGGVVTLRGPVLRSERPRLVRAVRLVRGVHGVVEELEVHDEPGNVPALQGVRRLGRHTVAPSTRLLLFAVAGLFGLRALGRAV